MSDTDTSEQLREAVRAKERAEATAKNMVEENFRLRERAERLEHLCRAMVDSDNEIGSIAKSFPLGSEQADDAIRHRNVAFDALAAALADTP